MLHLPHRPHHPRHRVAALTLALSALPLVLLPATALATTGPAPRQRSSTPNGWLPGRRANEPNQPNKAQIEHHEAPAARCPARHRPAAGVGLDR